MKTLLLFALFATATTGSFAQSTPAKAPPRKPTATKKTSSSIPARPAASGAARQAATAPGQPATLVTPAANRTNSEKVPAPVKTGTPARVAQPARTAPVTTYRQPAERAPVRTSSGLGFEKNSKLLNLGVGLSSYYYGTPIGLSYEAGISDDVSVGGQIDYNSGSYDDYYGYNYRYRYSAYYVGVRGSYHFNRILNINQNKVDLYAGLGVGYQSFKWNDSYYGSGYGYNYGSGLFLNYFIGGKYYFTNKVGAFLELGYTGLSSSRIGLAVKF